MIAPAPRWFAPRLPRPRCWLLLALALSGGCIAPLSTSFLSGSRKQQSAADAQDDRQPGAGEPAAAKPPASVAPLDHEQALAGVLDELKEIRAIDPAAEAELMADLREANPEHYPMIVETFRTALAYRQQLAEREQSARVESHLATMHSGTGVQAASHDQPPATLRRQSPRVTANMPSMSAAIQPSDPATEGAGAGAIAGDEPATAVETEPLPPPPTSLNAVAVASEEDDAQRPSAESPTPSGDWQTLLAASIDDLQRTVNPKPTSNTEIHAHMRLRTLQLLAGQEEAAYQSIPGTSPAQQDYWSKQLFAMAAYLDGGPQLDDKQRAAAAIAPLDEALAKLSELATLQIHNLAFAESVQGFGAYEPIDEAVFQPGEQVAIYAEVANYRSNSTEKGYETSIGTSYQVLDKSGRRVEGRQFPDVKDECRNRRRDFHMQYGVALPKAIYPGSYDLEITITDHLSGKIAQSTLSFEIRGER